MLCQPSAQCQVRLQVNKRQASFTSSLLRPADLLFIVSVCCPFLPDTAIKRMSEEIRNLKRFPTIYDSKCCWLTALLCALRRPSRASNSGADSCGCRRSLCCETGTGTLSQVITRLIIIVTGIVLIVMVLVIVVVMGIVVVEVFCHSVTETVS